MPLVRIDLIAGKPAGYPSEIGAVIYDAMTETLGVPADDRFEVITEHARENFIFDPGYLGITRTEDCVFIQVTLNAGRTVDTKRAFTGRSPTDCTEGCRSAARTYSSTSSRCRRKTGPSATAKRSTPNNPTSSRPTRGSRG